MTVKEYLKNMLEKERRLNVMKQQYDALLSMAKDGSTPGTDTIPSGTRSASSRLENLVCKALELEARIKAEQDELDRNRNIILKEVSKLSDTELQNVIIFRYFKILSWEDVAKTMGRSLSWVYKAHGIALLQLDDRLEVVA